MFISLVLLVLLFSSSSLLRSLPPKLTMTNYRVLFFFLNRGDLHHTTASAPSALSSCGLINLNIKVVVVVEENERERGDIFFFLLRKIFFVFSWPLPPAK